MSLLNRSCLLKAYCVSLDVGRAHMHDKVATLVAWVESDVNKYALRFEKGFYDKISCGDYVVGFAARYNRCSKETARVICATSWGMYQIMGYNLYGVCGFDKPIGVFLGDENIQTSMFHVFWDKRVKVDYSALFREIASISYLLDSDDLDVLSRAVTDAPNVTRFIECYNGAKRFSKQFAFYLKRLSLGYKVLYTS